MTAIIQKLKEHEAKIRDLEKRISVLEASLNVEGDDWLEDYEEEEQIDSGYVPPQKLSTKSTRTRAADSEAAELQAAIKDSVPPENVKEYTKIEGDKKLIVREEFIGNRKEKAGFYKAPEERF